MDLVTWSWMCCGAFSAVFVDVSPMSVIAGSHLAGRRLQDGVSCLHDPHIMHTPTERV